MSRTILFDIETGALPESELTQFMPDTWPVGNAKDPAKVAAIVAEKKAAWLADAALDALTGQILAIGLIEDIGVMQEGGTFFCLGNDEAASGEKTLLKTFWDFVGTDTGAQMPVLIGFNCNSFDLPFLIRRTWKHGLQVPVGIRRGRYWGDQIIDLRDVWQCGDRQACGSLDTIAKHLGIGAKTGNGKDFAALWHTDRTKAMEYLTQDLRLTEAIAKRFGVL